jgi:catalase
VTRADFLAEAGRETPVFVRVSTVAGSRGSSDTPRDVRGFATKFYTREGNYDLVGNNMPVFFIQDGIKFPDFVHAVKPEPRNEIPQAASAHDTLWDFVSLQPETMHMMMWLLSDRAIPRSYRMMQGFGVHTFRFVNAEGRGTFVKFHWRPRLGTHSLVWDEAQKIAGDPDFNRRDLWDAIEACDYPNWDFCVQLVPEEREHDFDFDLLDATKLIPEEEVPLRVVGRLELNRNPDNFFAETEQVAFHTANVVPGIDFTNDPLLQARNFSYLDTQLIRLGGPNFVQIPVNRPGRGGPPPPAGRVRPAPDRRVARLLPPELDRRRLPRPRLTRRGRLPALHRAGRGTQDPSAERELQGLLQPGDAVLELDERLGAGSHRGGVQLRAGKVRRRDIRERVLGELAHVDRDLAGRVAASLGLQEPPRVEPNHGRSSPALSQANQPESLTTRKIAVLAADGVDAESLNTVLETLRGEGAVCEILAPHEGTLEGGLDADRGLLTMASVLYDAVLVAGGRDSVETLRSNGAALRYVAEAYKHAKPIGAIGHGVDLLRDAPLDGAHLSDNGLIAETGVITIATPNADELEDFAAAFAHAVAQHRHFARQLDAGPA